MVEEDRERAAGDEAESDKENAIVECHHRGEGPSNPSGKKPDAKVYGEFIKKDRRSKSLCLTSLRACPTPSRQPGLEIGINRTAAPGLAPGAFWCDASRAAWRTFPTGSRQAQALPTPSRQAQAGGLTREPALPHPRAGAWVYVVAGTLDFMNRITLRSCEQSCSG
jgi:hypothetical protein